MIENIKSSTSTQIHLSLKDTTNLGSFYTPEHLVQLVMKHVQAYFTKNSNITNKIVLLDSSAGYGAFLEPIDNVPNLIVKANDIDEYAYLTLQSKFGEVYNNNALYRVKRSNYKIAKNDFLIIIGNPPYNDHTSHAKRNQKENIILIDEVLQSRDLGISFLKSYDRLKADVVCVLHPFAYLAKMANFRQLKEFRQNYKLKDAVIFSSQEFSGTSRNNPFPVCMALYVRDINGMDYGYIKDFNFSVLGSPNTSFKLANLDSIANYVGKYPKKELSPLNLYFYTLRDINALKRNKTFLPQINSGSIPVTWENLYWYCYIDVFKEFSSKLPYYYGNCDVFVNVTEFKKIADSFFMYSFINNTVLNANSDAKSKYETLIDKNINYKARVTQYFRKIFADEAIILTNIIKSKD